MTKEEFLKVYNSWRIVPTESFRGVKNSEDMLSLTVQEVAWAFYKKGFEDANSQHPSS